VLSSVVSVFFYIRVVVMMYMAERTADLGVPHVSRLGVAALSLAIVAIFYLGILPTGVLNLAANSIGTIF
jgi:NADH-quinone oxidoreductase subunit N